ncbi:hypothetical protein AcV5_000136 [Taiwanofungus camphoratus]|nr:hypothetical protein AcV5_000136 [Antrodia cinnamomea]
MGLLLRPLIFLRWDHILFSGGVKTGRIVATAASKHVIPITLEPRGKSPVVIDSDVDLKLAARRILYGKLQNSGQMCFCPDYVLVPRDKVETFTAQLVKIHNEFWPKGPFHEDSSWSNINPIHHARIKNLLEQTKGGWRPGRRGQESCAHDRKERYI